MRKLSVTLYVPCLICIRQKPNLISTTFPTILTYNINEIYECNPYFIRFQFIQKSSDINHYLKFSHNISFELISDTQNTSNHYKSHESNEPGVHYCKSSMKTAGSELFLALCNDICVKW